VHSLQLAVTPTSVVLLRLLLPPPLRQRLLRRPTQQGVDLTYIASYALSDAARNGGAGFTLNAALDMARDEIELDRPLAAMVDDQYSSVHVVPGLQYRLSPQVDFVAEVGLGINQSSDDYVGVGTSYYFIER
jgi:hypothetical protein